MVLWLLAPALAGVCAERVPPLLRAEEAAGAGKLEEADLALQALQLAFGCGGPAEPDLLARMWVAEARIAQAREDTPACEDAIAAARGVSPQLQIPPEVDPIYPCFRSTPPAEPQTGTLTVEPPGIALFLDGQPLSSPASAPSGLHLLQGGPLADQIEAASVIFVPPAIDLVIRMPVQLPPPPPPPPAPRRTLPARDRGLLVLGAATAVGGGVLSGVALSQNRVMSEALTHEEVDAAFRLQRASGIGGYALFGASLSSVLLVILLP